MKPTFDTRDGAAQPSEIPPPLGSGAPPPRPETQPCLVQFQKTKQYVSRKRARGTRAAWKRVCRPPPPVEAPGTPAPTDIQVAAREGGSNHQQMGLRSAGLVQDAARLKGRRCHRHGDGWPPVLMLITAKHTAQLQRQHGRDSGRSHRQDVSGAENKSIFDP